MAVNSWQEVDKLVSQAVKNGTIHAKTFNNTPKAAIRAITFKGKEVQKPRLHEEWKNYSNELLIRFDKVFNDIEIPNWDNLFFRNEEDFKSGSFGLYPSIWMIMINNLPDEKIKYLAYNHIVNGISILSNQKKIEPKDAKEYERARQKFHICTKRVLNEQNNKLLHKMNHKGQGPLEISGNIIQRFGYYPVQVNKQNGSLIKTQFYQPNGDFLLENPQEITNQIIKWVKSGALELVGHCNITKSLIRTSMVLVFNENSNKFRTCFDGGLLKLTEEFSVPCKLDTVTNTLLFIDKDDYMCKFDDASGFLQAFLDEQSRDLTHTKWGQYIFRYYGAAFGIPRVPGDFQLLNSCAVSFLRAHGVPVSLYLDDRLVIEKNITPQEIKDINNGSRAPKNAFLTTMAIIAGGGFISRKKSTPICKKEIEFLGFTINTRNETISIPKIKWEKFQMELEEIINSEIIEFKQLERLRGKMCSFCVVVSNLRLYIRRVTEYLVQAEQAGVKYIQMDERLKSELQIWQSNNVKYIKTTRSWVEKQSVLIEPKTFYIWTDASDIAAGYKDHNGEERTIYFNDTEMQTGIVIKEALAILRYLEYNMKSLKNKRILFYCDNVGVVTSFYSGSKCSDLNDVLRTINMMAIDNNMHLLIFWVSTDIQQADKASRTIDLKEEILSDKAFAIVTGELKPTIDCMATSANAKCEKYYSRFHEDMALGTNFLTIKPDKKENLYCFPPKTIADITARHVFQLENKYIFIFHVMNEFPFFVALRPQNSKLIRIDDKCAVTTLIPCRKRVKDYDWYKPNDKLKSLYAIIKN